MKEEIKLEIISETIYAKTRKLKAQWTYEAQQDMMWFNGVKIEEEKIPEEARKNWKVLNPVEVDEDVEFIERFLAR